MPKGIRTDREQLANSTGKEVFEIHPVILGGDPIDPANKVILTREEHIQAVRFWNKVIAEERRKIAAADQSRE